MIARAGGIRYGLLAPARRGHAIEPPEPMQFATVTSLLADVNDLGTIHQAMRRLHIRTGDEMWAECASRVQELIDCRERVVYGQSWVERLFQADKPIVSYDQQWLR